MQLHTIPNDTGCPSYIVVDELTHMAALVNPQRELGKFRDLAGEFGFSYRYVIAPQAMAMPEATLRLAGESGARVYVFEQYFEASGEFELLRPGDVFEFGNVRLRIQQSRDIASCMLLSIYDLTISEREPQVVLGESHAGKAFG